MQEQYAAGYVQDVAFRQDSLLVSLSMSYSTAIQNDENKLMFTKHSEQYEAALLLGDLLMPLPLCLDFTNAI